jgi:hypothetical protein
MDLNGINALLSQLGVSNDPVDLSGGFGNTPQYLDPNTSGYSGTMPPNRAGLDEARAALLQYILKPQPQMQQAKPVQPAFRTGDALAGLLPMLLMGAFGGKKGWKAADQYGQGYIGGKMNKAQMDTQVAAQGADIANREAQGRHAQGFDALKAQLGFSEEDYNRDYGDYRAKQATDTKMDLEAMKGRMKIQSDEDKRKYDERKTMQKALLSKLSPEGRRAIANQLGLDQATQDALAELTVDEELKDSKTKTENALRDPRVNKAKADVERVIASKNLSEAQKSLVLKKVEHYDAEFKARIADINSRIQKRTDDIALGKIKAGGNTDNVEIADRNRLIGIARAQIKRLEEGGLDLLVEGPRFQALQDEIVVHESRIQEIVATRMATGQPPVGMDKASIRKKIAADPNKARANAAIRAIDGGADPIDVYKRFFGGR